MTFPITAGTTDARTNRRKDLLRAAGGALVALTVAAGLGAWQVQGQADGTTSNIRVTEGIERGALTHQPDARGGVAEPYRDATLAGPARTGFTDPSWDVVLVDSEEQAGLLALQLESVTDGSGTSASTTWRGEIRVAAPPTTAADVTELGLCGDGVCFTAP
jgi:hypothetical protein